MGPQEPAEKNLTDIAMFVQELVGHMWQSPFILDDASETQSSWLCGDSTDQWEGKKYHIKQNKYHKYHKQIKKRPRKQKKYHKKQK